MCKCKTCKNGLTDIELMAELEEMGYDFRIDNQTHKKVKDELSKEDFDWSGVYEMAINEGFYYCETCKLWHKK